MEIFWTTVTYLFTIGVLATVAFAFVRAATIGRHRHL